MTQEAKERSNKVCVLCNKQYPGSTEVCPDDGMLLTPIVKEPKAGDIFAGRYEILGVIGDGGMGKVYKARHSLMKRLVAIKMLLPHLVQNAAALKRFTQEAQAASALKHPHILYVHDFGISEDGIPYLVMDFLEGVNLSSLLQEQGFLPEKRAVNIFLQACSALAHAHSKGVIHRDIKPANIMLIEYEGQSDFLQIVDFGIAKLLQPDGSEQLTQTGEVFGSPLYMSPEQCRGKELDTRSDIYSLGCVFYRTLSGHPVFSGRDAMECMYKQVNEAPCRFADVCPELAISANLEEIVFKAIAKDPEQRFQTMAEFKEALEATNIVASEAVEKLFAVPPSSSQVVSHEIITDKMKASGSEEVVAASELAANGNTPAADAVSPAASSGSSAAAAETQTEGDFEGSVSGKAHMEGSSLAHGAFQGSSGARQAAHDERAESAKETASESQVQAIGQENAGELAKTKLDLPAPGTVAHEPGNIQSGSQSVSSPPEADVSGPSLQQNQGKLVAAMSGVLILAIVAIFYFSTSASKQSADKAADNSSGGDTKKSSSALVSTAEKQVHQGDFKNAETTLKEAASKASDDKEMMRILPQQARVYEQADKFAQAQESWAQLEKLQEKNKTKASDIARTKTEVAENMLQQNNIDEAEPLLDQAEKVLSAAPASENQGLSNVWSALSKSALKRGDYNKAVEYLQKAINRKSAEAPANDPELAHFYQDLAVVYIAQGRLKEAEKLLDKVLKSYDESFGKDSAQAADAYKFLGTIYFQKNQLAKAESLFQKALNIKEARFGKDSLASAEVMSALAMLYTREKKYGQAEPLFKSALEVRTKELGADSPQAQRTKEAYAKLQTLMGSHK